jgi:eukaryotic-like serine/threonine-protein kinase
MRLDGTTFAGFSVEELINCGGLAEIYRASDMNGQKVAIRILLPEFRHDWVTSRRFRWGSKVVSQLNHPNVVRFYGEGKYQSRLYEVLEYVDGPNLKEKILRNDPQLRTNQLKLLVGMAAGLSHIHDRGFLHLDFKPENVVVSRRYDPKIVDFDLGIYRPSSPKRTSKLSGTPAYLAPEQIARRPIDERADIFAYGITAYEMLSGKKPVTGATREEVMQKYANFDDHLKPLRSYVPDIPQHIEKVISKCLEKDVMRRYPSMALVVRDLQK